MEPNVLDYKKENSLSDINLYERKVLWSIYRDVQTALAESGAQVRIYDGGLSGTLTHDEAYDAATALGAMITAPVNDDAMTDAELHDCITALATFEALRNVTYDPVFSSAILQYKNMVNAV